VFIANELADLVGLSRARIYQLPAEAEQERGR
jgi:predicted DNA-binding transcriptional regulator AlpA